jgi:hypothetical protein
MTMGGRVGGQKFPKLRDVINGQPLSVSVSVNAKRVKFKVLIAIFKKTADTFVSEAIDHMFSASKISLVF